MLDNLIAEEHTEVLPTTQYTPAPVHVHPNAREAALTTAKPHSPLKPPGDDDGDNSSPERLKNQLLESLRKKESAKYKIPDPTEKR